MGQCASGLHEFVGYVDANFSWVPEGDVSYVGHK